MYTLYYAPGACSLAVHVVLEWIGHPYRAQEVKPGSEQFLAVNPAGTVPALDIGTDQPLTQCGAILHYLARRFPDARLAVDGNLERTAEMERWSAFLTGDLHPAFFPVFMPGRYTADGSEAALAHVRAAGIELVRKRLALLDRHLEGREHMLGAQRTYVDAYTLPMVRWAGSMLDDGLGRYPDIARHHAHLLADVGVREAMRQEKLPS